MSVVCPTCDSGGRKCISNVQPTAASAAQRPSVSDPDLLLLRRHRPHHLTHWKGSAHQNCLHRTRLFCKVWITTPLRSAAWSCSLLELPASMCISPQEPMRTVQRDGNRRAHSVSVWNTARILHTGISISQYRTDLSFLHSCITHHSQQGFRRTIRDDNMLNSG